MEGKIALVIGSGGGGIGTALSVGLAQMGATVIAVDFALDRLDDTRSRLASLHAPCAMILADIRDVDAAKGAVAEGIERMGQIDYLINVAGGSQPGENWPLEEYPDRVYQDVMRLNLRYVFAVGSEVARHMIARGIPGSMVNLASVAALQSSPYTAVYGVAKAGVVALTKTMAVEWGGYGIRVNAVVPGDTVTPRKAARPAGASGDDSRWKPLARRCQPEEVVGPTLFLLSDLASMITGQALIVDGGASARTLSIDPANHLRPR